MKTKNITTLIIFIFAVFLNMAVMAKAESPTSKAKNPTSTVSPSGDVLDKIKQIEILKEKIATKVAEIRNKDKTAVMGTIKKIDKDIITVQNRKGEQTVTYSDDTIFYSLSDGEKKEATVKKLSEEDTISVLGYFNDDKTKTSAKYIFLQSPVLHILGKIVDVDKNNFTITVKDKQGNQIIDIETTTKISLFVKNKGFSKGGFSKFQVGDNVHVVGIPNSKETTKITGLKVYDILQSIQLKTTLTPEPTNKKISPTGEITPTKTTRSKTPTPTKKTSE